MKIYVPAGAQAKERQDKTQFTSKIDGFMSFAFSFLFCHLKKKFYVNIEVFGFFFGEVFLFYVMDVKVMEFIYLNDYS